MLTQTFSIRCEVSTDQTFLNCLGSALLQGSSLSIQLHPLSSVPLLLLWSFSIASPARPISTWKGRFIGMCLQSDLLFSCREQQRERISQPHAQGL